MRKNAIFILALLCLIGIGAADEPFSQGIGARAGFDFPFLRFSGYYDPSPVVGVSAFTSLMPYMRIIAGVDMATGYPPKRPIGGTPYSIDPRLGIRLLAYPRTQFMPFIEGGGFYTLFSGPTFPYDPDGTSGSGDEHQEGGNYSEPGFYAGFGFDYQFEETIGIEVCLKFQTYRHNGYDHMGIVGTGGGNYFFH